MVFFQSYAPQALNNNLTSILLVAGVCYAPFIYIVLFANYFYYKKARATIGLANHFFEDHQDKITWITNKAGTSNAAALAFIFIAFTPLLFLVPGNGEWLSSINFKLPGIDIEKDEIIKIHFQRIRVLSIF